MATNSSYLKSPPPIPKVVRIDEERVEEIPLIKSEWPSVSSKSKKALPVDDSPKYQFYFGEPKKRLTKTRTIHVPMDRIPTLGAWASSHQ